MPGRGAPGAFFTHMPPSPGPPRALWKVLRSMKVVGTEDVVVGQYRARANLPGYLDDTTVPKGR
jgi:hypothetical protein